MTEVIESAARPEDLAHELGITGRQLRRWLRLAYPRDPAEKGLSWHLSVEQVAAARLHFAQQLRSNELPPIVASSKPSDLPQATLAVDGERDWFWEGSVQTVLATWLEAHGWRIEARANTAIKEQGDDLRASKEGRTLRVEVKGWPTKGYADPRRRNEIKRASPSTQAAHWFGQAILRVIRDLGRNPADPVAIGLPDWPRFRSLLSETREPLTRLGIGVLLVSSNGEVEEWLPIEA